MTGQYRRFVYLLLILIFSAAGLLTAAGPASAATGAWVGDWTTLGQYQYYQGIAVDSAGNVYVTVVQADTGVILKKAAGSATWTDISYNAPFKFSNSGWPVGIAADGSGNVYVTNQLSADPTHAPGTGQVDELAKGSSTWSVIGGWNVRGGQFYTPVGIAVDSSGNVYVTDDNMSGQPGLVWKLPSGSGTQWSTFGISNLTLKNPSGIAVGGDGTIYVADTGNNRIVPSGYQYLSINKNGGNSLNAPFGVAADSHGNLYETDGGLLGEVLQHQAWATRLAWITQPPGSAAVGATLSPAPKLALEDAAGDVVSGDSSDSVTVSLDHNQMALGGTPTATLSGGQATFNLSVNQSGSYTLTASSILSNVGVSDPMHEGVLTVTSPASNTFSILSSDASLSGLGVSAGTLTPGFAPGATSYTDNVGYGVSSITVTPTTTDPNATVKVNGATAASGSPSGPISLSVGGNTITVQVTAQDGTTTDTYTVVVTRAAASSDASLSGLSVSAGTLTPNFAAGTTSYTDSVGYGVSNITVTPTTTDTNATIKVNGAAAASGSSSGPVSLSVGDNTFTILVTAQDGTTTDTYTVVVTRAAPSSDASLASVLGQAISPTASHAGTAADPLQATVNVANSVATAGAGDIAATDPNATVAFYGTDSTFTTPVTGSVSLTAGGATHVYIKAVAQDGTTALYYAVTINRAAAASTDATLSSLTISSGTLSPAFASGTTDYTAGVGNSVTSLTVTPTVNESHATVQVNSGSASNPINLNVGSNTVTVMVTAQDGTTTDAYTITVTRAAAAAPTYTVTFDSQGGSPVASITGVISGSTISAPAAPTKTGYSFGGWFKKSACANAWNFGTATVAGDITLYAEWTANTNNQGGGGDGGSHASSPPGVTRLAGENRVATALAIAQAEYPGQIENAVLAHFSIDNRI